MLGALSIVLALILRGDEERTFYSSNPLQRRRECSMSSAWRSPKGRECSTPHPKVEGIALEPKSYFFP